MMMDEELLVDWVMIFSISQMESKTNCKNITLERVRNFLKLFKTRAKIQLLRLKPLDT